MRAALGTLLTDLAGKRGRVTKREISALYNEKIGPELQRMKVEIKLERRRQVRRTITGAASLAASVALGAFAGPLPLLVKGAAVAAAAATGARLLPKAAESMCEHGADLREKNDFYFLLRLAQQKEG